MWTNSFRMIINIYLTIICLILDLPKVTIKKKKKPLGCSTRNVNGHWTDNMSNKTFSHISGKRVAMQLGKNLEKNHWRLLSRIPKQLRWNLWKITIYESVQCIETAIFSNKFFFWRFWACKIRSSHSSINIFTFSWWKIFQL